jgi:NAD(P)-dependent dehydrogenase (short-subunit alcohol dehydrogenase family)
VNSHARTNLAGRRALITGASSGIGEAIALALAGEGVSVAVCGRDRRRTAAVRRAAGARGPATVAVTGDVAIEAEAERIVEEAVTALGGLDILVNNAGIDMEDCRSVHEIPVETWDRIIDVNLRGAFLMSKFSIPHLLRDGGGTIVHVGSVGAITVWAGDCAYDVSKAGLSMLSDHIAVEYASHGIRSNTIMPGVIRTPLLTRLTPPDVTPAELERRLAAQHPVGRLGTVAEVAEAAVFLCGSSGFLTGAHLVIDGAYSRV